MEINRKKYGSEKVLNKIPEEASKINCRVKGDSDIIEFPIVEVVVRDLVLLETGDKIPADGYLIEGNITVDEYIINRYMISEIVVTGIYSAILCILFFTSNCY